VKAKLVILASLAMLGVSTYLVTSLTAQAQGQPSPAASAPASTKVGMVNMAAVLKGYNKVKVYKDQMDKWRKPYDDNDKKLRDLATQWQKYAVEPTTTAEKRQEAENNLKTIKRQMEDNQEQANKELSKKGEEQMVQMYKEFEKAVQTFAQTNGFHMVFHYSEPLADADKYVGPNVQRKLVNPANAGSVCPVYIANGLDVTVDVLNTMNSMFPAAAAAAAPAGTQIPAGSPGGTPPK
jgi:outer membrane protein